MANDPSLHYNQAQERIHKQSHENKNASVITYIILCDM